jgi:hypothetical protein
MPIHAQMSASTALACAAMVIGSCIAMPAQNSRTAPRVVAQAAKRAIRVKTRRPAVAGRAHAKTQLAHVFQNYLAELFGFALRIDDQSPLAAEAGFRT